MAKSARFLPTLSRRLAAFLGLLTLVVFIAFGVAQVWSPRSAGQPIAARLGIAYPTVIAHRGLSYWAPEETRAAYLLARELGADYLEADVQRTRDGILIVLHDDTLARTTNVATIFPERRDRGPEAFTWAELQRLDAGSWFNAAHPDRARPAYVGLPILRLDELLELARGSGGQDAAARSGPGVYLETKDPGKYAGCEHELVALLAARGWLAAPSGAAAAPVLFQSFDATSLARLRELAPAVPRVLLLDRKKVGREPWTDWVQRARELGAGLGPSGYEAMPWHTGPAHRAGLLVHHYTINQVWQLRLIRQLGSDGVFTDTTDLALAVYGRRGPSYDRAAALQEAFQKTGL